MMNREMDWPARGRALKLILAALAVFLALPVLLCAGPDPSELKFEVSFSKSAYAQPITGRVFVIVSRKQSPEPRLRVGGEGDQPPFFGVDVSQLEPGRAAIIDGTVLGFPVSSLQQIPAGDYYVQALINVYTEFHRADGHVIWAHMDHWEGQQFNRAPGNVYSSVEKVHLDPTSGYDIKLKLTNLIPPVKAPADTAWVKHVKIQSTLLTQFWGRPMYLGATVLLPKGYDSHPNVHYPVVYDQGHFGLRPPFFFSVEKPKNQNDAFLKRLRSYGYEQGWEFAAHWASDDFPRMMVVTFQHPTPFFDDSYAVNSVNNGPYGDALITELIPYLESHFRMIRKPYARLLTGGSTGGWESVALQLYHPDFFGGTWTFWPDPIDFRNYGIVNIYHDDNAFIEGGHEWLIPERPLRRQPDGQTDVTLRQFSQLEAVLGSHARSCQQLNAWESVYGPVGADGYPEELWDKRTGKINHAVADYMRDHGYDLRAYAAKSWSKIGPELQGKIHIYVGDMDSYFLNLAVYRFEDFMKSTENPHNPGYFEYGRPMKPHGWVPMTQSELLKQMAQHINENAPAGEDTETWSYR
ncbi:MAG: alpha/beta hydrolase-fold protein [Terriglobia bacterium]